MLPKLPSIARNFYVVTLVLFLVWMLFFDQNDFISQYRMVSKKAELENEHAYYSQRIPEASEKNQALIKNSALLEKIAREEYLMKKQTEEVIIIEEEND